MKRRMSRPLISPGRDRRGTVFDSGERGKAKTTFTAVYLHLFDDLLVISESKSGSQMRDPRRSTVIHSDAHAYERSFLKQQEEQLQVFKKRRGKIRNSLMAINLKDCSVELGMECSDTQFVVSASDKCTMLFQVSLDVP